MLLLHIASALIGILISTLAFLFPSRKKLLFAYLLAVITVVTGAGLTFFQHQNFARTCVSGVIYLAVVFFLSRKTKLKLIQSSNIKLQN